MLLDNGPNSFRRLHPLGTLLRLVDRRSAGHGRTGIMLIGCARRLVERVRQDLLRKVSLARLAGLLLAVVLLLDLLDHGANDSIARCASVEKVTYLLRSKELRPKEIYRRNLKGGISKIDKTSKRKLPLNPVKLAEVCKAAKEHLL